MDLPRPEPRGEVYGREPVDDGGLVRGQVVGEEFWGEVRPRVLVWVVCRGEGVGGAVGKVGSGGEGDWGGEGGGAGFGHVSRVGGRVDFGVLAMHGVIGLGRGGAIWGCCRCCWRLCRSFGVGAETEDRVSG